MYKGLVKRQNVVWEHARLVFYKLFEPFSNRMNLRFVADEKPLNHVRLKNSIYHVYYSKEKLPKGTYKRGRM